MSPFQASISAYDIDFSMYRKLISQIQSSNYYDYIVIDTDSSFSDEKGKLFDQVDKILILTLPNRYSIFKTNVMLKNINASDDRFMILCNALEEKDYAYAQTCMNYACYSANDSIEWIQGCEQLQPNDLASIKSIQKIAFAML